MLSLEVSCRNNSPFYGYNQLISLRFGELHHEVVVLNVSFFYGRKCMAFSFGDSVSGNWVTGIVTYDVNMAFESLVLKSRQGDMPSLNRGYLLFFSLLTCYAMIWVEDQ